VSLNDFFSRMRRGLPILLVLGFSASAPAQECPGVRIAFRGSRWSAALSDRVRDELKVEVLSSGLCAQSGPTAAAQIDYVWEGREPLGVSVTFGSGAAQRTVARRLDPNGVPADGLPLVLAAVTGELLSEARAVLKVPLPSLRHPLRRGRSTLLPSRRLLRLRHLSCQRCRRSRGPGKPF
jgi:hypothetical protein